MSKPILSKTKSLLNDNSHLSGDQKLDQAINDYLQWDQYQETRDFIKKLTTEKDWPKLRELLGSRLQFGTAGIRGKMGPGFSRLNDLVIIQTSQGVAKYLLEYDDEIKDKGIVIGYDGRHNSKRFAERTAVAFLSRNIPVYLYSDLVPTPFIPFSVKLLGCSAGIMITASHNPKNDNGYKLYFGNGAQIISPHDKGIQEAILSHLEPWEGAWKRDKLSLAVDKLPEIESLFYDEVRKRICDRSLIESSDLGITYTAMHGVSHKYMTCLLKLVGFKKIHPVAEQSAPDPEFPTVPFPNPEEKGALDLSIKSADSSGSTLILANDPDADRCAAAEKQPNGKWKVFTGNELGQLLGAWLWSEHLRKDKTTLAKNVYMIGSAVSSKFLDTMAKVEGFNFIETLTGFKWMGNKADELVKEGKKVLLAFEEAIGYMCGTHILDKDGITASIEVAQMAVWYKKHTGRTLAQQLDYLYDKYGIHCSNNGYFFSTNQELTKTVFNRLSNWGGSHSYPASLGSYKIVRVRDLNRGYDTNESDKRARLPSDSSSYMLTFYFSNGAWLTIRTSGTEPKVKYYSEMCAAPDIKDRNKVEKELSQIIDLMTKEWLSELASPK
ncbi:phosphoglucomutase-2 isoform X2 [Tetranychus urticae]|uniref:Phosphoglucomutase-2 n=1 Tax=Tetranychus urticae TaxID=32264 RepID=T1JU05_TETUR|nr:phosphoglucomutase-2 isoform X2 [Tetranychus urticae]